MYLMIDHVLSTLSLLKLKLFLDKQVNKPVKIQVNFTSRDACSLFVGHRYD